MYCWYDQNGNWRWIENQITEEQAMQIRKHWEGLPNTI